MRKTKTKQHFRRIGLTTLLIAMSFFWSLRPILADETATPLVDTVTTTPVTDPTTTTPATPATADLEARIRDRQAKIQDLERQQQIYQQTIDQKQKEELTLQNELAVLDTQISSTSVTIEKLDLQVQSLDLQVRELDDQITIKENDISQQKVRLAELLRALNKYNRKTMLEVSLLNDSLSKFFNQLKYLQTIEGQAKKSLDDITALKTQLVDEQTKKQTAKDSAVQKQTQLATEKNNLVSQQTNRQQIFDTTKNSEAKFASLLDQAKREQDAANADIQSLEAKVREQLAGKNELPQDPGQLIWPIDSRIITTYFHDPNYVFRKLFAHPAIDVATPQGTPIRAAASGFVGRARDVGYGYSYIMLVHGNNLSTVYGHVSKISVIENDFIAQGQIIGYTGGTPGTPGAGNLTTGPHLHFEVRASGIPQNPLSYLQ